MHPILQQPLFHCDFETGGLNPRGNPILSVAISYATGDVIHDELYLRCRCPANLSCHDKALEVNGLNPNEGDDEDVFLEKFLGYVKSKPKTSLVAFNAQFEHSFLSALFDRHNKGPMMMLQTFDMPVLCSMQLASLYFTKHGVSRKDIRKPGSNRASFSQEAIYYKLFNEQILQTALHNAQIDVLMSMRIFNHVLNDV